MSPLERAGVRDRAAAAVAEGAPQDLADRTALLGTMLPLSDMAQLAREGGWDVTAAARIYHAVGDRLAVDRLQAAAFSLLLGDYYQRQAARQLLDDLYGEHAALARSVIAQTAPPGPGKDDKVGEAAVRAWAVGRQVQIGAVLGLIEEIERSDGGWTFAKLTVANAALRDLASASGQAPSGT